MTQSLLHREIEDWTREVILSALPEIFPWIEFLAVYDGATAALLLRSGGQGTGKGKKGGGYYPDGLVVFEDTETGESSHLAIEVGKYDPDKAPDWVQVLHISYGGRVILINVSQGFSIALAIQEVFQTLLQDGVEKALEGTS
jgi:hypothetical protein